MGKDSCELVFIIDRSGSMHGLEADTIGGINSTLDQHRKLEGEANVSIVFFDTTSTVIVSRKPIGQTHDLTRRDYTVGGCTALLDAVGDAVRYHKKVNKALPKNERAGRHVFVIITDGYENASRRWSYEDVKRLIEKQRKHGWEFLFLGANIDAAAEASRIGIAPDRASRYVSDHRGNAIAYDAIAQASAQMRVCGAPRADWNARAERDAQRRAR